MSAINAQLDYAALRRGLLDRLARFRARLRRHLVLEGGARWLAELVAVALLSFTLDRLLRLSVPTRLAFVAVGAIFLAYEFWRFVLVPARLPMDLVGLAAAIDRKSLGDDAADRIEGTRPVLAARVASVLELPALLDGPAAPSPVLVRTAVLRCHDALDAIDFEHHIDADRRRRAKLAIAALVLIPLALAAISPRTAGLWFRRYFMASAEPWPQKTYLLVQGVTDGAMTVPRAEPFALRVTTKAGSVDPDAVTLRYREGKGARSAVAMSRFGPGDWRYEFPPLGTDAEVEITGNDDVEAFAIRPVDRPKVTELLLISQHPTEPKPTTHNFGGQEADLSFLPKTKLELSFTANVPIESANVKGSPAAVRRIDDRKFAIAWEQSAPVQLQIELLGSGAHLTSLPTPVAIGLKQDLPPRVSLTFSGVRSRVTPMARIPLAIQARDDFGVAKLDLTTKTQILMPDAPADASTQPAATTAPATAPAATQPLTETVTTTLVGPILPPTDLEVQYKHELEVASLKLPAGSILNVTASATDACYLGAQTGASRQLTFRVVPPEELFREILLRQQSERVKFRKQVDAAQKLGEDLKTLTTPEQATAVARDHRATQREVLRIANSLAESVTEMKLNGLGGKEAWDLMDNKVLAPLKRLNDDLMNQQKDALDALKPGDAAALTAAGQRQEKVVAAMQEALKQMSQWDSFVDVINQLNEIIKLETKVHQSTDTMKKKQTEGVFD